MEKVSPYYQYDFISIEPTIALIKEELKGYLDTGAIDDSIWSIYVDKCLRKLGKGMLQITPVVLNICNYQADLPYNFDSVREAWLCTTSPGESYQLPGADYQEVTLGATSSQIVDYTKTYCDKCDSCTPETIKLAYKTTHEVISYHTKQYLLKPGNISTVNKCHTDSLNLRSQSPDTFDITNNKFRVNFVNGTVYLLFYAKNYDEYTGYQLVPDNFRILEYIEAFIKYKVFEQLSNQVTDETYNQIAQKKAEYKAASDEAFVIADIESKKETMYDKARKAVREKNRFNKYNIR